MSGRFAVSREAGRALMGVCIAVPAVALVVKFFSRDPSAPYDENPNKAELLVPPHVSPPIPRHVTEKHARSN